MMRKTKKKKSTLSQLPSLEQNDTGLFHFTLHSDDDNGNQTDDSTVSSQEEANENELNFITCKYKYLFYNIHLILFIFTCTKLEN
ncbi:hypothetical protein GLOIN_2v1770395 [Rhizophagus irregularis DAOM 181602=DAOM 197198]|nr:hypothetical protein GLOIN_2v1770395 [Rhizophagus irregularis DAOM 181602=DAOM 197198]